MNYPVTASNSLPVPAVKKVTKPEPHWLHIVGIHFERHGEIAAVWLGVDREGSNKQTGKVTLYDSYVFSYGTHLAVISDGLRERGKWKPIAWRQDDEEFIAALRKRDCRTLWEGYEETVTLCEVTVRELDERLVNGTFTVLDTNAAWMHEYENFGPKDGTIPQENFPLMSATRHALHYLKFARPMEKKRRQAPEYGGSVV